MENPYISCRYTAVNQENINPQGKYVLYWMLAFRRLHSNFALQRAIAYSNQLQVPLVILEGIRIDYPWACDRFHQFMIDGMIDHQKELAQYQEQVFYYSFIETQKGQYKGLLPALAQDASIVITDDYPNFFMPKAIESAAQKIKVKLEKVDSNGIFPLSRTPEAFTTAFSLRRFLQKNIAPYFYAFPQEHPLKELKVKGSKFSFDPEILQKYPITQALEGFQLSGLEINHEIKAFEKGGEVKAIEKMHLFIDQKLDLYHSHRNEINSCSASGLSAYLHFGHLSMHLLIESVIRQVKDWHPDRLKTSKVTGSREGYWQLNEALEGFLDEAITWRELGFIHQYHHPQNYDQYDSLPDWAKKTLEEHEHDIRPYVYDLSRLENAQTHDPLWNAAQNQLRREGKMHNYLRMLWGKKILEWSKTPKIALDVMIELNNKYATDGRDPNSYSGIFWCLGRYDRAWGPEREIFGKIRYMSSDNTSRKIDTKDYISKYS